MTARALAVAMIAPALVLALVLLLLRSQPSPTVAGDGAENPQPPPLAAPEGNGAAIDAVPGAPAVAAAAPASAEAVEPTPVAAPLPTRPAPSVVADIMAASGATRFADRIAERDRRFAEETVDPDWAPRTEAEILRGFAQQTGLELMSLQVECRATTCRVQMTQPKRDGAQSNALEFLEEIGLYLLVVLMASSRNGQQSSVAYVLRFAPTGPSSAPPASGLPNPLRTDP